MYLVLVDALLYTKFDMSSKCPSMIDFVIKGINLNDQQFWNSVGKILIESKSVDINVSMNSVATLLQVFSIPADNILLIKIINHPKLDSETLLAKFLRARHLLREEYDLHWKVLDTIFADI